MKKSKMAGGCSGAAGDEGNEERPMPALSNLASAKLYTDAQNGAMLSVRMPGDCLFAAE